ncbi:DNA-binding protein [Bradyrhizobium sp. WSM 1704]|uniref:DNA-binding protein n=1 Tax=Bradyrhizobium semiaridum TaxID=2821404 RepID=UPI001CE31509|nr:DNA-binding protein [Bradyrhizobium semiaridum]MCA6124416.1 DNA-binding protein [Bradyrhizobium semiaridum]
MPTKQTIRKAMRDKRAGKSPSTQAGEFVREEIEKVRRGEHGARSTRQAVAIGLSEARRAGVNLRPPRKGKAKRSTRRSAKYAYEAGQGRRKTTRRPRVSRAVKKVLKREPHGTVSRRALSRQTKGAAARRSAASRSAAARKAARTKGVKGRSAAAKKAARTRARRKT